MWICGKRKKLLAQARRSLLHFRSAVIVGLVSRGVAALTVEEGVGSGIVDEEETRGQNWLNYRSRDSKMSDQLQSL